VGARSAVFAPIPSLRLIVVDEEHELAYKQEDTPRYHGRDLAVYRAMLNEAGCILGSATPSLETFRNVERKKYGLSQLSKRIDGRQLPLMHIVDMRLDARRGKGGSVLSQTLVEAMRERYEKKEQTILFLNRRGFNTTMLCTDCGFVEECKDCSIALTFHRTDGYLRCHLCGFRKVAPRVCGSCKSIEIRKKGHGTQRVEDLVSELMPRSSRVVRVDADMMTKKNLFRETLRDFRLGKIDVLVGTQMIAKGLDFPNVTLVGVIDADLPLRMEDFRASERAFQLLVQVAGRAGRGDRAGEVYVQTYAPHSSSIQFSRKPDIYGFLEEEMEMRKELEYPPFRHLIRHIFRGRSLEKTEFYSNQWRKKLEAEPVSGVEVKGPALAPIEKIKGYYRFHLFYLTASVFSCLKQLEKRREDFPLDPEIHDILDVDAHQMS
jgi:primosomal protein N' (replication factor Y)